jgi:hypothetical protein
MVKGSLTKKVHGKKRESHNTFRRHCGPRFNSKAQIVPAA